MVYDLVLVFDLMCSCVLLSRLEFYEKRFRAAKLLNFSNIGLDMFPGISIMNRTIMSNLLFKSSRMRPISSGLVEPSVLYKIRWNTTVINNNFKNLATCMFIL